LNTLALASTPGLPDVGATPIPRVDPGQAAAFGAAIHYRPVLAVAIICWVVLVGAVIVWAVALEARARRQLVRTTDPFAVDLHVLVDLAQVAWAQGKLGTDHEGDRLAIVVDPRVRIVDDREADRPETPEG
jgi:hypothetical protein